MKTRVSHKVLKTFLASLCLLGSFAIADGQSVTDGSTPLALSAGAPAGSYSLSGFDSVNLYNGSLNFSLPLVKIAGRGGAGYTMSARIEQKWLVDREPPQEAGQPNLFTPNPNWWNIEGFIPILSAGRLDVRQAGTYNYSILGSCGYVHNQTLTRLTFTTPDGTEFELRDQLTNGQPKQPTSCDPGFDRGKVFVTSDGSSAIFTSDEDIKDYNYDNPANIPPSGDLITRDGTHYRIDGGTISWMRDRNGNKLSFTYASDFSYRVTGITDSLNRQVTISYATSVGAYDLITLKGFGGAARSIKVYKSALQDALRSDCSLLNISQLFPELNGAYAIPNNPQIITAVELPNGQAYHFYYNSYAELARVVLPTGGAIEYDYAAGLTDGAASGVIPVANNFKSVYRRVIERRTYPDGGTGSGYASRMTYSRPESTTSNAGYTVTDQYNSSGTLLNRSTHYFYGSAKSSFDQLPTQYPGWEDGREYQTTNYAADGTTALQQVTHTFAQRAAVSWWTGASAQEPPNDPRLIESDTTLLDTNQVSKETFAYDDSVPFNNQNDVKQYDFGNGSPGSLVRETQTTFVTSTSYTDIGLESLPSQTSVFDGGVERARTTFEYDNYASDANHHALIDRTSISGFDSSFSTSYTTRGNVTGVTHYLLNSSGSITGSVSSYAQFDVAGNLVKAIDARGYATTLDYRDNFGAPADTVESNGDPSNTAPSELGSAFAYAFPFGVTNALGQVSYVKFDYYLGRPVTSEDINGVISRGYYDDSLDRSTQMIRAVNGGTDTESQTTFSYDDTNHFITTTSDQSNYGDNVLKSQLVYDGFGRTTEKRQYEGGSNYIAVQIGYDALGRAYQTSNPFRPWQSETAVWATTGFDALGRVVSVTTPDSAVVSTAYSGNRVLIADQIGKKRISLTDGLGRLKEVWEVTSSDSATESLSFPGDTSIAAGYVTRYDYDTLDNLTSVSQRIGTSGTNQTRSFVYDSLKRLLSATNPESGTVCYGTVVSGVCQADGYDANGNLLYKTDARLVRTTYAYDALNRATSRSYSDSTPTVTYTYDSVSAYGKGRLASVSSSVSSSSYSAYDALGRALGGTQTISGHDYSITNVAYDHAGHVTSMTYPSGNAVTFNYDTAGRLGDKDSSDLAFAGNLGAGGNSRTYSSITGTNAYDAAGHLTQEQLGTTTAVYNKLTYNSRGQLAEIRAGTASVDDNRGRIVNDYGTTDNNGNLKQQTVYIPNNEGNTSQTHWNQQYGYDSLNRLTSVGEYLNGSSQAAWQQSYNYDRWGNRLINNNSSATWGDGINNVVATIDTTTNRMLAVNDSSHAYIDYDAAGNQTKDYLTSNGTRTYDAENRMITSTDSSNHTSTYSYDGDGRRVKRNISNTETWQVYGLGGELVAEYAQNADHLTPQKEYGYRNGQLLVTVTPGWGTAPTFNDNPLSAGETTVQARHITELRTAINALRSRMSMSAYSWQYSATTSDYLSANPILEMRTALDQALGPPSGGYASGLAQDQPVKAIHIQELRDRLLAAWQSGVDLRWMVTDQLGTPRMIFDQSGSLANVSRHDYMPFGEELSAGLRSTTPGYTNSDGTRQKFTQKERDNETGLDYFEARYYSSNQGRFTSPDEFKGGPHEVGVLGSGDPEKQALVYAEVTNPQSLNKYQYTFNNPLRYVDPDGHDPDDDKDKASQNLTITQVSAIVFNETQSLSGDTKALDTMYQNVAHAIINGDNQSGDKRPVTASDTVSKETKQSDAFKTIVDSVKTAANDAKKGVDPTDGAQYFNLRPNDSQKPFQKHEIKTHDGPFKNSYPSRDLPKGKDVYVNTYKYVPPPPKEKTTRTPRKHRHKDEE